MVVEQIEKRNSRIALLGLGLSLLAVLLLLIAVLGYRWGLWHFRFSIVTLNEYVAYAGAAGAVVSLIGLGRAWPGGAARGLLVAVAGVVIGAWATKNVYDQWFIVQTVPFIHDITTDTENPPEFIAVVPEREAQGAAPHEYEGPALAAKQRYGYPDLAPLTLDIDADAAFDRARKVAETMDWVIVDVDPDQGRIEATAASFWYGFKDDMVIRVTAEGAGSRIDMRALARKGRSDLGKNAARIRAYLAKLGEASG
jgi:uncharacterized protein (DUF1499 family)|tara:strand:+ start:58 stop:819 length:762 start_codon:yes stop_codon:yes gene_type:complete